MARCPFATWLPLAGTSGSYTGGPAKIVHHTTEGSTANGAFREYRRTEHIPHFTVDETNIYQHADTDSAVSALANQRGGVQTNRDTALQMEVVGFAQLPKTRATLRNVGRLCRWLEQVHNIPQTWPNGYPNPPRNGGDPGGHNRDARTWDAEGGHYGHSQVPENIHWDPAYTRDEVEFLMAARFTPDGDMINEQELISRYPSIPDYVELRGAETTMPDHHEVQDDEAEDYLEEFNERRGPVPIGEEAQAILGVGLIALGVFFLMRSYRGR